MTMSDTYTQSTRTDWSTRIAASIKGIGAGIILAGLAGYGLFWNEGSAVRTAKSLTEGAGLVVNIDAVRVDSANEGKLVHVSGEITAGVRPNDAEFGVAVDGLLLARSVDMFQWREDKKIDTNKGVGGGEDAETTYSYKQVWSSSPINSQEFKIREGHVNPAMRFSSAT